MRISTAKGPIGSLAPGASVREPDPVGEKHHRGRGTTGSAVGSKRANRLGRRPRAGGLAPGFLFVSTVIVGTWAPPPVAAWQEAGLQVVVIEGQDRVNVVGEGTSVPVVVGQVARSS